MEEKITPRVLDNSALGSWAGYVYQGLCGIYHCIRLIGEDRDKYVGYKLFLDSYEDFAIMNDADELVSLHQCKDEKMVKDYSTEYRKMRRKLKILEKFCADDCKLYFHTNKIVNSGEGIILYPFTDTQEFCGPGYLLSLIKNTIFQITKKEEAAIDMIVAKLVSLIDKKVLDIHQRYVSKFNRTTLKNIAKSEHIEFNDIIDILFAEVEVFKYDRVNYINHIKYKLLEDLNNICEADERLDVEYQMDDDEKNKILFFVNRICAMNVEEMERFLQRVHPTSNLFERNVNTFSDIASNDKANCLFKVVTGLELLKEDLSWDEGKGKETPTSLSNQLKVPLLCKKIIDNSKNLDVLYEYDWLIGDVQHDVSNIGGYLKKFSDVNGIHEDCKSIFATKKVGILTIDSKKNGKYD